MKAIDYQAWRAAVALWTLRGSIALSVAVFALALLAITAVQTQDARPTGAAVLLLLAATQYLSPAPRPKDYRTGPPEPPTAFGWCSRCDTVVPAGVDADGNVVCGRWPDHGRLVHVPDVADLIARANP